jgi:hypothetical protein
VRLNLAVSRSKHTDPRAIRSARRAHAPRDGRGAGDLSGRGRSGQVRKQAGIAVQEPERLAAEDPERLAAEDPERIAAELPEREPPARSLLRIIVRPPQRGFHHPAGKQDVVAMLQAVGPSPCYGLHSVELGHSPAGGAAPALVFGRYQAPGRIVLVEQPLPPWRLPALLPGGTVRRLRRAGAVVTRLPAAGATLVDWPPDTLRRFMLEEILLHELGHHVLQHEKGKRPVRVARTRDHEAFARRFARQLRAELRQRGGR